jgi:hypothetical protein
VFIRRILRLERAFDLHFGQQREDSFDHQIINGRFYFVYLIAFTRHVLEHSRQLSLTAVAG